MNQRASACTTNADVVNASLSTPTAKAGLELAGWLLIASMPVIFALATWPISGFPFQDIFLRHFSLPVLAIELVIILLALSDGFETRETISKKNIWIRSNLYILLLIAVGTAFFVAPDKPTAVIRTTSSIIHLLFGLSLYHLFGDRWQSIHHAVWPGIAIGIIVFIGILAAFVASVPDPETYDWTFFKLGATHLRQVGFYSAVGAGAAFGLALVSLDKRIRWAWIAVAAIALALSFWSGTRSSIFAFAGAYFVSLRMFPALRRMRAVATFFGSLLAGLALSLLHQMPDPAFGAWRLWSSSSSSDPGSGRFEIWLGTLRVLWERPLFGFGESQFRFLVPEALEAYNHPHNWIIQILLQWGVVGAACYFALAAHIWVHFEKRVREIGSATIPAYLVVTSLLLYSLVEGTMSSVSNLHAYRWANLGFGRATRFNITESASVKLAAPTAPKPGRRALDKIKVCELFTKSGEDTQAVVTKAPVCPRRNEEWE